MKLLTGCVVSAGLFLTAFSANAQMLAPYGAARSPYQTVSDLEEPYGGLPPAPPPYGAPPPYAPPAAAYGYEPELLPPREVYAVLRENGFQPLGMPFRRGLTYEISAIGPDGEDGRLLIDGRDGRIIRFTPAYWRHESELTGPYGAQAALPSPTPVRGVPRPPAPIPHVASRAAPLPASKPARTAAVQPQQQAQVRPQPQASAVAPAPTTAAVTEAKPSPAEIRPTQDMPAVQDFE